MTARILQGDCLDLLPTLAPGSVDVAVTSPPYWGLRDYGTGTWEGGDPDCGHKRNVQPRNDRPDGLFHGGTDEGNYAREPQYRDTCGKCGARRVDRQLGLEATPEAFVDALVRVFRLVRVALAPHGTCWVNIGDTYCNWVGPSRTKGHFGNHDTCVGVKTAKGIGEGNLALIPQRLALALQADGWICRSVIIWQKKSPMPQSLSGWAWRRCRVKVKEAKRNGQPKSQDPGQTSHSDAMKAHDPGAAAQWADCPGCDRCRPNGGLVLRRGSWRPTSSWEPILMLAKAPGYFADGVPVQTPAAMTTTSRDKYGRDHPRGWHTDAVPIDGGDADDGAIRDSAGANARDVQTWAAEPLKEKHYASFPTALVHFCLAAGTSAKGYCPQCGAPWARVVETRQEPKCRNVNPAKYAGGANGETAGNWTAAYAEQTRAISETLGWRPTCPHGDLPPRPGLVLDPFSGSGRVGIAAQRLGLDFTGIELNPAYCQLAVKLLTQESPLFCEVDESRPDAH